MTYADEMKRCSIAILLRAVIETHGNQCQAAKRLGIHRNTMSRILSAGGWTTNKLKRFAAKRNPKSPFAVEETVHSMKKPVVSDYQPSVCWRSEREA